MHPSVIICLPGFSKIKSILFKMVSELSFASASGLFLLFLVFAVYLKLWVSKVK